jgi:hypothetical protein
MEPGILNLLERIAGGVLYHCCFCRLQFYDRRELAPRTNFQPIPAGDTVEIELDPSTDQPHRANLDG